MTLLVAAMGESHRGAYSHPFRHIPSASALPSLVLARGHRIEEVEEVPLVVATWIGVSGHWDWLTHIARTLGVCQWGRGPPV